LIDTANCVADSWHRLGFQDAAEITSTSWVTSDELYQYADDAVKYLARTTALFLTYDSSIAVRPFASTYALPASHVFTQTAWLNNSTGSNQQLRITSAADLWALDQAWPQTNGPPTRVSFDAAGATNAVVYPAPTVAATLWQVMGLVPPAITSGNTMLELPAPVQDYLTCAVIAGARSKESDSAMPEVAAHLAERMRLYEAVFQQLWGTGR
jgi:hypothetical protein